MTGAPVTIRTAHPRDEPALRALDRLTWNALTSPSPLPPPERPFLAPGEPFDDVLVAEIGNRLAGYVRIGRSLPLESNAHVLEVKGLAVDPAMRRRGVGQALLRAAVAEAAARGARRLTLRVLAPNAAARALYASCGFREEGILRGEFHLEGADVDDVLMGLDLRAAAD